MMQTNLESQTKPKHNSFAILVAKYIFIVINAMAQTDLAGKKNLWVNRYDLSSAREIVCGSGTILIYLGIK